MKSTTVNAFVSPTFISVTVPCDFDAADGKAVADFAAFSALVDETTKAGGDWMIEGPFSTGLLNGAILTGRSYSARMTAGAALDAAHAAAAEMLAKYEARLAREAAAGG